MPRITSGRKRLKKSSKISKRSRVSNIVSSVRSVRISRGCNKHLKRFNNLKMVTYYFCRGCSTRCKYSNVPIYSRRATMSRSYPKWRTKLHCPKNCGYHGWSNETWVKKSTFWTRFNISAKKY